MRSMCSGPLAPLQWIPEPGERQITLPTWPSLLMALPSECCQRQPFTCKELLEPHFQFLPRDQPTSAWATQQHTWEKEEELPTSFRWTTSPHPSESRNCLSSCVCGPRKLTPDCNRPLIARQCTANVAVASTSSSSSTSATDPGKLSVSDSTPMES